MQPERPSRYTPRPTESLRGEASRRGVSLAQIRGERARAEGLSAAAGRGHPRRTEAPVHLLHGPAISLGIDGVPPIQLRRGGYDAGRAHALLSDEVDLLAGRLSPAAWDARWAGRRIGGVTLPDADEILALAERGEVDLDRLGTP